VIPIDSTIEKAHLVEGCQHHSDFPDPFFTSTSVCYFSVLIAFHPWKGFSLRCLIVVIVIVIIVVMSQILDTQQHVRLVFHY